MTLRSAWTWFAAWGVGTGLVWAVWVLPVWPYLRLPALVVTPIFLCCGIGLVQYVVWTYRDDMEKAWGLLFMIPIVYFAQALWMFPMMAAFDTILWLTSR